MQLRVADAFIDKPCGFDVLALIVIALIDDDRLLHLRRKPKERAFGTHSVTITSASASLAQV